jgi:beta-barrel assembly-enhancing protease
MLFALLLLAAPPGDLSPLVAADRRLVEVGRRLAKGGAGFCAGTVSNPGWTLADVEQYRPEVRAGVKASLGIGALPTVVAVEPGGAAAQAGVQPGDALVSIDGQAIPPAPSSRASRTRLALIERAAPVETVTVSRGGRVLTLSLRPEPGCPSHFLIGRAKGLRGVSSDGRQVGVSPEMLDYVANDDELALVLAHELAHNILGHNKGVPAFRAAGQDRSGLSKKSREAEADRWALYLMARAGYDLNAAPGFWRRWGPKTSFGIFNAGTHPGWRDRAAAAQAEIARIRAQQGAGQVPIP